MEAVGKLGRGRTPDRHLDVHDASDHGDYTEAAPEGALKHGAGESGHLVDAPAVAPLAMKSEHYSDDFEDGDAYAEDFEDHDSLAPSAEDRAASGAPGTPAADHAVLREAVEDASASEDAYSEDFESLAASRRGTARTQVEAAPTDAVAASPAPASEGSGEDEGEDAYSDDFESFVATRRMTANLAEPSGGDAEGAHDAAAPGDLQGAHPAAPASPEPAAAPAEDPEDEAPAAKAAAPEPVLAAPLETPPPDSETPTPIRERRDASGGRASLPLTPEGSSGSMPEWFKMTMEGGAADPTPDVIEVADSPPAVGEIPPIAEEPDAEAGPLESSAGSAAPRTSGAPVGAMCAVDLDGTGASLALPWEQPGTPGDAGAMEPRTLAFAEGGDEWDPVATGGVAASAGEEGGSRGTPPGSPGNWVDIALGAAGPAGVEAVPSPVPAAQASREGSAGADSDVLRSGEVPWEASGRSAGWASLGNASTAIDAAVDSMVDAAAYAPSNFEPAHPEDDDEEGVMRDDSRALDSAASQAGSKRSSEHSAAADSPERLPWEPSDASPPPRASSAGSGASPAASPASGEPSEVRTPAPAVEAAGPADVAESPAYVVPTAAPTPAPAPVAAVASPAPRTPEEAVATAAPMEERAPAATPAPVTPQEEVVAQTRSAVASPSPPHSPVADAELPAETSGAAADTDASEAGSPDAGASRHAPTDEGGNSTRPQSRLASHVLDSGPSTRDNSRPVSAMGHSRDAKPPAARADAPPQPRAPKPTGARAPPLPARGPARPRAAAKPEPRNRLPLHVASRGAPGLYERQGHETRLGHASDAPPPIAGMPARRQLEQEQSEITRAMCREIDAIARGAPPPRRRAGGPQVINAVVRRAAEEAAVRLKAAAPPKVASLKPYRASAQRFEEVRKQRREAAPAARSYDRPMRRPAAAQHGHAPAARSPPRRANVTPAPRVLVPGTPAATLRGAGVSPGTPTEEYGSGGPGGRSPGRTPPSVSSKVVPRPWWAEGGPGEPLVSPQQVMRASIERGTLGSTKPGRSEAREAMRKLYQERFQGAFEEAVRRPLRFDSGSARRPGSAAARATKNIIKVNLILGGVERGAAPGTHCVLCGRPCTGKACDSQCSLTQFVHREHAAPRCD